MRLPTTTRQYLTAARSLAAEGDTAGAAAAYSLALAPLQRQSRRETLRRESALRVATFLEEKALESKRGIARAGADRHTAALRLAEWLATGTVAALA
jgi:hypothetical protein